MTPRGVPRTCREAAVRFREMAERAIFEEEAHLHNGRADVLEALGDAPVPRAIVYEYFIAPNLQLDSIPTKRLKACLKAAERHLKVIGTRTTVRRVSRST